MKKKLWLVVLIGLALGALSFAPLPLSLSQPSERTITIHARSYEYHPAVIRVNPGDTITFRLISEDVVHGIYIDGYDLSLEADPGQTSELVFTADRRGSFRLRCSVTCGALHPFMIGKLEVGPSQLFWRAALLGGFVSMAVLLISGLKREDP
jgi:heme/copper-type cytochrome/quinol oxidase subunit 2